MTLLDSIDSILMLYSYTGFAEHRFRLFEPILENDARDHKSTSVYREAAAPSVSPAEPPRLEGSHENETETCPLSAALSEQSEQNGSSQGNQEQPAKVQLEDADAKIRDVRKEAQRELVVKRNMMSGLSILLTLMSIVVAFRYEFPPQPTARPDRLASPALCVVQFSISLITIMGLIGDNCVTCRAAADNDKGLAGGWWRFWAEVRPMVLTTMCRYFKLNRDRRTTTRVISALASSEVLCWSLEGGTGDGRCSPSGKGGDNKLLIIHYSFFPR